MIGRASVAAATAVVGYDLFSQEQWNVWHAPRVIKGIMVAGSTAINDTLFDLFIGQQKISTFSNSSAGAVEPLDQDYRPIVPARYIPAGSKISAIVTDAAAGNPIVVVLL